VTEVTHGYLKCILDVLRLIFVVVDAGSRLLKFIPRRLRSHKNDCDGSHAAKMARKRLY
jgi:hypothetical protein